MAEKIKIDLDIDAGSSLKTMGDLEASVESMMEELKKTDVAVNRIVARSRQAAAAALFEGAQPEIGRAHV